MTSPESQGQIERNIAMELVRVTEELVGGEDVFFAATGVSSGELLKGVRYFSGGAQTQSVAIRCRSGTCRWIDAWHNFHRLDKLNDAR